MTNPDPVESVADAVMHEGFLLYPYRPSALKNRQRWNFGVVMPPEFCARADNGDRAELRVECVAEAEPEAQVSVKVRFLQLSGDDAIERVVALGPSEIGGSFPSIRRQAFAFGELCGYLDLAVEPLDGCTRKISVVLGNTSISSGRTRDEALAQALLSCHALLTVQRAAFFSMVDAPAELLARANCQNAGLWPVLVGADGARDRMLASPIILYDYPRIAPESPAAMFDGTEIDELLSLRIQTLTEEEKAELRRHPRTAALLDRVDTLPQDELAALHGTWDRGPTPAGPLEAGDGVILRPKRRADILDLALAGRRATVISVDRDLEGRVHVSVTVDDDPGRDLGLEGKPGHRFFFDLDEVERI